VKPTVDEFFSNNKDLHLAMLACTVTLHMIDYVAQNRGSNPTDGDNQVRALKVKAKEKFDFQVVEGFALASKHCNLSSRPGFDHESRPNFFGRYDRGDHSGMGRTRICESDERFESNAGVSGI
jgi:hypothetical protein